MLASLGLHFLILSNILCFVLQCSEMRTLKREIRKVGRRCFMLHTQDIRTWFNCWFHMEPTLMQCMLLWYSWECHVVWSLLNHSNNKLMKSYELQILKNRVYNIMNVMWCVLLQRICAWFDSVNWGVSSWPCIHCPVFLATCKLKDKGYCMMSGWVGWDTMLHCVLRLVL